MISSMRFQAHFFAISLLFGAVCGMAAAERAQPQFDPAHLSKVAESKAWRHLLHYGTDFLGRPKSRVDGGNFFFAENGAADPLAELKASLAAMHGDGPVGKLKQHPHCAFPERYRFLRDTFGLRLPQQKCSKLEEFIAVFKDPRGVSLIFSSAYPNNPASMFGHTFLKVNSSQGSDLNDHGINFAAYVPKDDNGIAFAWFGMTGGYVGQWSHQPYYVKLNEYVNFESRDVWEYELTLTPDETLRLLHHLWEIETNSYMDYFFFDENCSFQILAAIVAIKPDWESILDHTIYVIPGETVKNVVEFPGAVRAVNYRPSHYKKLMQRYSALTAGERERFFALAEPDVEPADSDSRFVLDALAVYYDYLRNEKANRFASHYKEKRERLLVHRARLGPATAEEKARLNPIDGHTRPDWGHDPYSFTLGGVSRDFDGLQSEQAFSIGIKSAYHDLLNSDSGYSRYAHIDFPSVEFQQDTDTGEWRLEKLWGLATTSLHPLSKVSRAPSWKASFGIDTVRDYGCGACRHAIGEVGIGGAMAVGSSKNMLYGLIHARAEAYSRLGRGYRYGPGLDVGLLVNPLPKYKALFGVVHQLDLDQSERADAYTVYRFHHAWALSRNWEIRNTNDWLSTEIAGDRVQFVESKLGVSYFFR